MKRLIILFGFIIAASAFPQQPSNWQNYTDMKNIRSLFYYDDGIWAATGGGGFYYKFSDKSFKKFGKSAGLNGSPLSAVGVDGKGKIWFGSVNGIIDVLDTENNSFKRILDIYNTEKTLKQISEFKVYGDTIFVSTEFGLSLISTKDYRFVDTYLKFGGLPTSTKVNSSYKDDLLYVCTEGGLAVQKPGSINLSAPESWTVYTSSDGLPSNRVFKTIKFNNVKLISTDKGLVTFNGTSFSSFASELNNKSVNDIISAGDSLFILSNNEIYKYYNGVLSGIFQYANLTVSKLDFSPYGLLAGTSKGILIVRERVPISDFILPNGPFVNQFPDIKVDSKGTLWSASGRDVTGVGFYKFEAGRWNNFNMTATPNLASNAYFNVYVDKGNLAYFGSWGNGFVKVLNDSLIKQYDVSNTGMVGIPDNNNYLVISGIRSDSKNNLWILNYGPANRKTLSVLTPDSTWYHFPNFSDSTLLQNFFLNIDLYDTKWFISQDPARRGLYYYNENKTFQNTGDDRFGYLSKANGLGDDFITALTVDKRGDVWAGMGLGVNVISNTSSIMSSSSPLLRVSSVFALRQQTINCIAVDPLNQKWIGTNQGLLLVSPDGSILLAAYNSKNSPLLSDEIKSVAIDETRGIVYVGTDAGLTSFETPFILPKESFEELFLYPSPFLIGGGSELLIIDGLIRDSEIKILTISGKLVTEFSSPGGRVAYWDGKDLEGKYVSTGVYLIVAFDKEGNSVTTSKVAVLKK